jgi:hypothetical protein
MSIANPSINDNPKKQNSSQQKSGVIPSEVVNLYKKPTPKNKYFNQNTPTNSKQLKIASFLSKANDTRTDRFDTNRANIEPSLTQPAQNADLTICELNDMLTEANALSNEYSLLLENEDVNVKDMLKIMGKMNKTMIDLIIQLKNAVETKNNAIVNTFTNKLKDCTSFISKEINYVKKEIDKVNKNDEIECIKTAQACSRDIRKIWIRFIYANDAEQVRNKNNHAAIKEILSQLNIPLNMSQYPLESFYLQSRTFSADQLIPEIALCCIFVNSTLSTIVKNGIIKFNKNLEEKNQQHLMRYKVSTDWSYNVRLILKPCNEMRRHEVIDRVYITNDGIKVYHKEIEQSSSKKKSNMTLVNSLKKLDKLRKSLKDYNFTVPAVETYNEEYFKLNIEERKILRTNFMQSIDNNNDDEVAVSDDEFLDASVVETNQ